MLKTYCLIFFFCFLIEFGTRSVDYDGSLSVFWRRMLSDLIYRRAMPASVSVSFMWFRPRHSPLASRLISTSCDPSVIKGILHLHPLSYILSRELLNEVFGGVGNRMIIETSLDNEANVPRIDQSLVPAVDLPPNLTMCTKRPSLNIFLFRSLDVRSPSGKVLAVCYAKVYDDRPVVAIANEDVISFDVSVSDLDSITVEVSDSSQESLSEYLDLDF